MKCSALTEDENDQIVSIECDKEAVWYSCVPVIDIPVCEDHKCRCNKPILHVVEISGKASRRHF